MKLTIAIQKSGKLSQASRDYLNSLGFEFSWKEGDISASCLDQDIDILFLRDDDIPRYVVRGVADLGIVGQNVLAEKKSRAVVIRLLDFGKCSLVIAVPKKSRLKRLDDLEGERVATSYPAVLSDFLKSRQIRSAIIPIHGSVEVTVRTGLADAICDLTQTGKTLQENNLKPLMTLFQSTAVLVRGPRLSDEKLQQIDSLFKPL